MQIVILNINDLTPYENNAKEHPAEQIEQIKRSIEAYGNNDPIGVWGDKNIIVEGHGRYIALKELGYTEVECIRLDHLTEEERKAYTLVHNKTTMNSDFNFELLEKELKELSSFDIDMTKYGFDALAEELEEKELIEDEVPALDEDGEPLTKLGDVWVLDKHKLICGDSTDAGVIKKLMQDAKADLVFTDPPYGMKKENEGVLNDNLNYDDLLEFNKKWVPLSFDALKDNGSWYCWGTDEPLMDLYSSIIKPMIKSQKATFRNLITWDKGNGQGQLSADFRMYPIADEKCLFIMCGVQGFNTNQDNYYEDWEPIRSYLEKEIKKIGESDKVIAKALGYKDGRTVNHWWSKSQWAFPTEDNFRALQEYAKTKGISIFENKDGIKNQYEKTKAKYEELKKQYYSTRAYFDNTHDNQNNVWHFDRTSNQERELTGDHATPKPIALCARGIKSSSREGDIVLDFFGGSGSTLIACEQLKRCCYMVELDPKYCDVIVKRWEALTGKKAVKL